MIVKSEEDWMICDIQDESHNHTVTLWESHSSYHCWALTIKVLQNIKQMTKNQLKSAQIVSSICMTDTEKQGSEFNKNDSLFDHQNIYNIKAAIQ